MAASRLATLSRFVVIALEVVALGACSGDRGGVTDPGVVTGDTSLPVTGAVYRGAGPHLFFDGGIALDCGSHGGFTNAIEPPTQAGGTVVSDYTATFVGELVLMPPAVSSTATYALSVPASMAERITLTEVRGTERIFATELVTFEIRGAGMPANVVVRESPDLDSAGLTTIAAISGGQNRIESYYDVWLEVSLDDGRTWHRAQGAVRMTLGPA